VRWYSRPSSSAARSSIGLFGGSGHSGVVHVNIPATLHTQDSLASELPWSAEAATRVRILPPVLSRIRRFPLPRKSETGARTVRPSGRPVRAGMVTDVDAAEETTLMAAGVPAGEVR